MDFHEKGETVMHTSDQAEHVSGGSGVPDFDESAATWDDEPSHTQRAERVAAKIRKAVALRTDMRMLEYGAGTGLLSDPTLTVVGRSEDR